MLSKYPDVEFDDKSPPPPSTPLRCMSQSLRRDNEMA